MPATQRGSAYRLDSGQWGLRYYDRDGVRRRKSPFPSKSAALRFFRDHVEAELRGETPQTAMTLSELVDVYLTRHAANVRPRTVSTLRERLAKAVDVFGDIELRELERMSGDIASWQAALPERSRYGVVQALRQCLAAGQRWGHLSSNPATLAGRNHQPSPRTVRTYTPAEVDVIAAELAPADAALVRFAVATGLRPEELAALERRDIDRRAGVLHVSRTVTGGKSKDMPLEVVELAKTDGSRRQVPLSRRALAALDMLPPRLDTPLLFPAPGGGPLRLDNWRRRVWAPAIEAAGIAKPARPYDTRATFISDALNAGVPVFAVAKIAGTSVRMIERSYGRLLDGAAAGIAGQLDALDARREADADQAEERQAAVAET